MLWLLNLLVLINSLFWVRNTFTWHPSKTHHYSTEQIKKTVVIDSWGFKGLGPEWDPHPWILLRGISFCSSLIQVFGWDPLFPPNILLLSQKLNFKKCGLFAICWHFYSRWWSSGPTCYLLFWGNMVNGDPESPYSVISWSALLKWGSWAWLLRSRPWGTSAYCESGTCHLLEKDHEH